MIDPKKGTPSRQTQNKEEFLETLKDSRSDSQPNGITPLAKDSQKHPPCRSKHENVSYHQFKNEGEAFMIASKDNDDLRTIQELLSSLASDKWKNVMNDEIKSM